MTAREPSVESAVLEGRSRLLLFAIGARRSVPVERLSPSARLGFRGDPPNGWRRIRDAAARTWLAFLIALLPLMILGLSTVVTDDAADPGGITWLWCSALSGINLIFLVVGPLLWNALITAAIAIDD